ncbi:copper resistance protein NlpE, partial [Persicitalea sp.]|uniref:copper resistance protein NlpE n=1 Tax=Persicitalea sp. TaxID=3100273 RepID=UPI003593C16F
MRKGTVILVAIILASCNTDSSSQAGIDSTAVKSTIADGHNSRNSIDFAGTYTGVLPCADCEGIETKITLNQEGTYAKKSTHLGKGNDNSFEEKGNYTWDANGQQITLEGQDKPNQYFVGENTLTQLDMEGQKIEGDLAAMYVL